MKNNEKEILDCTFRDGGYYNGWNFSKSLINKHLSLMDMLSVKYVEIGFRFLIEKKNTEQNKKGECAFTSEKFLNTLKVPKNLELGIMINVGDLLVNKKLSLKNLKKLVSLNSKNSKIKFVRLATHINEIFILKYIIKYLKKRNYFVFVNLMQTINYDQKTLKKTLSYLNKTEVDVIYFADSTGSLDPKTTKNLFYQIMKFTKKKVGIHAHDNCNFAFQNTMVASDIGANWLDGTIFGMGRGPGNTKFEDLIFKMKKLKNKYKSKKLMKYIKDNFLPLKKKYNWGPNKYYELAGKYRIHPTYIQELLSKKNNKKEIIKTINFLRNYGEKSFSNKFLNEGKLFFSKNVKKGHELKKITNKKNLLILGPGITLKTYKKKIEKFIVQNREKMIIFSINLQKFINPKMLDYYISCHPLRLINEIDKHLNYNQPLILPFSMMNESIRNKIIKRKKNYFDYGLKLVPRLLRGYKKSCIIPNLTTLSYAIAIGFSSKVRNIYLAGIDGYEKGDYRRKETEELLEVLDFSSQKSIVSTLTPTTYKINQCRKII